MNEEEQLDIFQPVFTYNAVQVAVSSFFKKEDGLLPDLDIDEGALQSTMSGFLFRQRLRTAFKLCLEAFRKEAALLTRHKHPLLTELREDLLTVFDVEVRKVTLSERREGVSRQWTPTCGRIKQKGRELVLLILHLSQ